MSVSGKWRLLTADFARNPLNGNQKPPCASEEFVIVYALECRPISWKSNKWQNTAWKGHPDQWLPEDIGKLEQNADHVSSLYDS